MVNCLLDLSVWAVLECNLASFLGLPRFYLLFLFTIILGNGRPAKNEEGLGAFIKSLTSGKHRREGVNIQICTLWTWKLVSYQSNRVVSIMVRFWVEHLNCWSSELFWQFGPSPLCPPSRPPDVIHLMNAFRPSLFFSGLLLLCIIVNANGR